MALSVEVTVLSMHTSVVMHNLASGWEVYPLACCIYNNEGVLAYYSLDRLVASGCIAAVDFGEWSRIQN